MSLGQHAQAPQLHPLGHQQPLGGHEQRRDLLLGHVRAGDVDAEALHAQPAAVAEGDLRVSDRPVLAHT